MLKRRSTESYELLCQTPPTLASAPSELGRKRDSGCAERTLHHDLMSPALGDFFATCAYWTSNYYYYYYYVAGSGGQKKRFGMF